MMSPGSIPYNGNMAGGEGPVRRFGSKLAIFNIPFEFNPRSLTGLGCLVHCWQIFWQHCYRANLKKKTQPRKSENDRTEKILVLKLLSFELSQTGFIGHASTDA